MASQIAHRKVSSEAQRASAHGARNAKYLLVVLLFAAAYVAGAKVGLALAFEHPSATAVWPPTGISIAMLLLLGYRYWPGVALGAFISNVTTAGTVATSIGIATGNTAEALVGAWLVNRVAGGTRAFERPSTIVCFLMCAAVFAPVVSATTGVLSLTLGQAAPVDRIPSIWLTWWLGDAVSAIIIAPLLIVWCSGPVNARSGTRILELLASLSLILLIGAITLGVWMPWTQWPYPLAFLCIPPCLWIAFSFQLHGATLGMLALSSVAVLGTLRGTGPFVVDSDNASLILVQSFIGVIGTTILVVAAIVSQSRRALIERDQELQERRRVEAQLELHQNHLQSLVEERTRALDESHKKLRFAERLASMGTLAAGLGHDMANLLMPVKLQIDSLERNASALDAKSINAIRTSVDYLQRLAGGLRLLAADPEQPFSGEPLDLREWWREAEGVLRDAMGPRMMLFAHLPEGDCFVDITKPALTQILFNLVQNAADAMRSQTSGSVTLTVDHIEEGQKIQFNVADTGPGMSDEVRQRCFEPFFTTKSRGISTGMGLVLVHGLIANARGSISLDSAPGRGTSFTFWLPASRGHVSHRVTRHASVDLRDKRIGAFIAQVLRHQAYTVTVGSFSKESVLIVVDGERLTSNPDLVASLTDCHCLLVVGDAGPAPAKCRMIVLKQPITASGVRTAILALEELQPHAPVEAAEQSGHGKVDHSS